MSVEKLSEAVARFMEPTPKHEGQTDWWQYKRYDEDFPRARPITDPEIAMRLLKWILSEPRPLTGFVIPEEWYEANSLEVAIAIDFCKLNKIEVRSEHGV